LHQSWVQEAGTGSSDFERFCVWLIAHQYVTSYQLELLRRGHFEHFFLGDYKILDRLGRGRMAGVYRAVHRLGQMVAIKVLPRSKAKDATTLARFQREARLAVQFKHPNVVRTFQVGESDGLHYLVMEYLEGETLKEVLQRRRQLPPAEAVRIVHQALQGLRHLHELGMIHRDLKPANLMLVSGRNQKDRDTTLQDTVKILDIGLGKALFDEGTSEDIPGGFPAGIAAVALTEQGDLLGDPTYMAPEQARDASTADIRCDLYSLGCILYHCLAGRPPFEETTNIQLALRHATEAPRLLRDFNVRVADGLQEVVSCLLAKDPARRYPTPERAAQALRPHLGDYAEPVPRSTVEPYLPAYLTWLEDGNAVLASVPGAPALPVSAPLGPQPQEQRAKSPAPAQAPRPGSPVPAAPEPAPTVIENIPAQFLRRGAILRERTRSRSPIELSRRDWIMMGVGAGGILLIEALAYVLSRILGRKHDLDSGQSQSHK
jgi:serine/threonine protein kinase